MKRLLHNDWFAALLFLLVYLCTNSYIFGWDDQHVEIPLLKHYIDPALYKGDYYVEGLSKNFTSFLYPLLARVITIDQIPAAYLVLFLIARFFMFFWIYRLWQVLSKERFAAAMAVLMFILTGRTEEFLYRTFSHQEFSYIFVFAGLYYFYRERFLLAALIWGVGANVHALFNLFPMLFMLGYFLLARRDRWPLIFKTGITFTVFASPFIIWHALRSAARVSEGHVPVSEWMPLYLISCQQNFLFWTLPIQEAFKNPAFMLVRLEPYLFLLLLYGFLLIFEPRLRRDAKTNSLMAIAYALIIFSCVFTYVYPSRTVLDLNLLRNEYYARFMLMGYTALWAGRIVQQDKPWQALAAGTMFFLIGFNTVFFGPEKLHKYWYVLPAFVVFFSILMFKPGWLWLRRLFIILPLLASFAGFSAYHYKYLESKHKGIGFWQFYRNWVDMQNYVRTHTPKDALIMTPYDTETGGFRIFSERKVLVCYRDCGIIGFDYKAILEWQRRIEDIKQFKYMSRENLAEALKNAVVKYKVDYIVFMNYYQPEGAIPLFKKLYQNEAMALYEVRH